MARSKVAVISGANRGIGRSVARRLIDAGWRVSLGARLVSSLSDVTRGASDGRVLCSRYVASDARSAVRWIEDTVREFGHIDAVINNAGVAIPFGIEDENESSLDEMWEVNVKGPLRVSRAALPHLRTSGCGRVVTIASLSGKRVGSPAMAGYAMTKFAAVALSHAIRLCAWDDGVRATAICPSWVATDMTKAAVRIQREAMTSPDSVAELVVSMLSLPNSASVAEVIVNCQKDHVF